MRCSVCGDPVVAKGMCDKHYRRFKLYGDPLAGKTPQGEAWRHLHETYLLPVAHDPGWPYSTAGQMGYGVVRVPNIGDEYVHTLACTWAHGPRPLGMEVAHACRNVRCYWPEHLEWKTRPGNHDDMKRDGTAWVGGQAVAVLDRERAAEIVARYLAGDSQATLARDYDVSRTTIDRIVSGKHWTAPPIDLDDPRLRNRFSNAGADNPRAVLTREDAAEILARYTAGGCTYQDLGREYGVSKFIVYQIVHGKHWTSS